MKILDIPTPVTAANDLVEKSFATNIGMGVLACIAIFSGWFIVAMWKHQNERERDTNQMMLDAFNKNTEALSGVKNSIEVLTKIIEK